MKRPRPYQVSGINGILRALKQHRSVLYRLPTGGGKTAVAGFLASKLNDKGHGALFLVHRKELLDQCCETLEELGIEHGVIASGRPHNPLARFHVASVFTLARRVKSGQMDWLRPKLVIVDEAHHAKASTWETVLSHFSKSCILGLTATPCRLDGKPLGDHFQKIVHGPEIGDLVEEGYLAHMRVLVGPERIDTSKVRKVAGDFSKKDLGKMVTDKVIGDAAKAYAKYVPGRQAIFFGVNIDDSEAVAAEIRNLGYTAEHIDGETRHDRRNSVIRSFRKGTLDVICNVGLISEGFDVPACRVVIMGRPTMSLTEYLQEAGRGMRPKAEDDPIYGRHGVLLDVAGNYWRHDGGPDLPRYWTLAGEDNGSLNEKRKESAAHRQCGFCHAMYTARKRICPYCGGKHSTPVPTKIELELKEQREKAEKKEKEERDKADRAMKRENARREIHVILKHGGGRAEIEMLRAACGYHRDWTDQMCRVYNVRH